MEGESALQIVQPSLEPAGMSNWLCTPPRDHGGRLLTHYLLHSPCLILSRVVPDRQQHTIFKGKTLQSQDGSGGGGGGLLHCGGQHSAIDGLQHFDTRVVKDCHHVSLLTAEARMPKLGRPLPELASRMGLGSRSTRQLAPPVCHVT